MQQIEEDRLARKESRTGAVRTVCDRVCAVPMQAQLIARCILNWRTRLLGPRWHRPLSPRLARLCQAPSPAGPCLTPFRSRYASMRGSRVV